MVKYVLMAMLFVASARVNADRDFSVDFFNKREKAVKISMPKQLYSSVQGSDRKKLDKSGVKIKPGECFHVMIRIDTPISGQDIKEEDMILIGEQDSDESISWKPDTGLSDDEYFTGHGIKIIENSTSQQWDMESQDSGSSTISSGDFSVVIE